MSVQRSNGGLGFSVIGHFHESEAARAACIAIGDHGDAFHSAVGLEQLAEL
jgi:hypothetical protein